MTNLIESFKTSLRFRMTLGMAVMLLPLLVLGTGSILLTQKMVLAMEEVARTERMALRPVMNLQKLVLQAAMPPNDYLILGERSERILFDVILRQTDEAFAAQVGAEPFIAEPGRRLLDEAHREWQQARAHGAGLLALSRPVGNAEAGARMKVFDDHIYRAAASLNHLYDAITHRIEDQQSIAQDLKRQATIFMAVVFVGALGITVLAGYLLSRSIILPLRALRDGMFRFNQGDHSFRVALDRGDEFGHLAETLNTMASRLEFDNLTGVYNRAEFERRLRSEVVRTLRYGHVMTLLMLDIDRFKQVNDTHGHQAGDDVLRTVTMRLVRELRAADTIARYGGEEFAIIMPETGEAGARLVAERLRSAVAALPVTTTGGITVTLTISAGIATMPRDARSQDELISAADTALYAAKSAGRNRVVVFDPSVASSSRPPV